MRSPLTAAFVVLASTVGAPADAAAHADTADAPPLLLAADGPAATWVVVGDADVLPVEFRDAAAPLGVFAAELTPAQASALDQLPDVDVYADQPVSLAAEDQVRPAAHTWGLDRLDQLHLPLDGQFTHGDLGAGAVIYIVDTGVAPHVEFGDRLMPAVTSELGAQAGVPDCHGHGTAMASLAAGATLGVANEAAIVPIQIFSCEKSTWSSEVVWALNWVVANHPAGTPAVVNLSLGGNRSQAVDDAVAATVAAGIPVVAAAGNDTSDACSVSPAAAPDAVTVGASTSSDYRYVEGNYGPCVDVYAPGHAVRSAWHTTPTVNVLVTGTSAATAYVSGVVAALAAAGDADPAATVTNVERDSVIIAEPMPNVAKPLVMLPTDHTTPPPTTQPPPTTTPPPTTQPPTTTPPTTQPPPTTVKPPTTTPPTTVKPPATQPTTPLEPFRAITPARLLDTRTSDTRLRAGQPLAVQIAGRDVPTDAAAAVVNVTATQPTGSGYITAYPCGTAAPTASILNYVAGETVSNETVVQLDRAGRLCLLAPVDTHVIVDAFGWFPAAAGLTTRTPARLLDTRPATTTVDGRSSSTGGRKLTAGRVHRVPVAGRAGVPNTAAAAVINLTAVDPSSDGYITAYPCGTEPDTSSVNFVAGQTVANLAITGIASDGHICLLASASTHAIIDISGWTTADSSVHPVDPYRIWDSRTHTPLGSTNPRPASGWRLQFPNGVMPASAGAVIVNVTVTQPVADGWVAVYPCGREPDTSNVNYVAGQTKANMSVVGLSDLGQLCVRSLVQTHIVVDVVGWLPRS